MEAPPRRYGGATHACRGSVARPYASCCADGSLARVGDGDLQTEVLHARDQTFGELRVISAIEVVGPEVFVFAASRVPNRIRAKVTVGTGWKLSR